jgi:hypothetical protein
LLDSRYQNISHYKGLLRLFQQETKTLPIRTQKFKASGPLNVASVLAVVAGNGIKHSKP